MPTPSPDVDTLLADAVRELYMRDLDYRDITFALREANMTQLGRQGIDINARFSHEAVQQVDELIRSFARDTTLSISRTCVMRAALSLFLRAAKQLYRDTRNDEAEKAARLLLGDIKALHPSTASALRKALYGQS